MKQTTSGVLPTRYLVKLLVIEYRDRVSENKQKLDIYEYD